MPRQVMNIRWVGDHRHLDGAGLARFSNSFKARSRRRGGWGRLGGGGLGAWGGGGAHDSLLCGWLGGGVVLVSMSLSFYYYYYYYFTLLVSNEICHYWTYCFCLVRGLKRGNCLWFCRGVGGVVGLFG